MSMVEVPRTSISSIALALRQDGRQIDPQPRQEALLPISYVRGRAWFVASASSTAMRWDGSGFPAERAIEEIGFETYVPKETRKVPYRGKRVVRVRPLLGGYFFVRFDRERDDWGQIRARDERGPGGIDGMYGILRDALSLPIRVPDLQVDRMRRAEASGAFDFSTGKSAFNPGDDVQVTEGPFAGFIAKVRSASPQKRVRLIMAALGDLEIEPEFLERVSYNKTIGGAKNA